MTWRLSRPAQEDIDDIIAFFDERNPDVGAAMVLEVPDAIQLIEQHPELGQALEDVPDSRRHVVRETYWLLYRVDDDGVIEIGRVFDGRRDPATR